MHVDVRRCILRELKESKIMNIHWIKVTENEKDVFTKNLDIKTLVGQDVYMKSSTTSEQGGCWKVSNGRVRVRFK